MFPAWEESPESQAGVHYRFPRAVGNGGKPGNLGRDRRFRGRHRLDGVIDQGAHVVLVEPQAVSLAVSQFCESTRKRAKQPSISLKRLEFG